MERTKKRRRRSFLQPDVQFSQKRLTWFCVLVVGTAVLLVVYMTLLCGILYFRYQKANRQIPVFRDYYQNLALAADALDTFVINEEAGDYASAQEYLNEAQESLNLLESSVRTGTVTRELLDLEQLTGEFRSRMTQVGEAMDRYHGTAEAEFQTVTDSYQEALFLYDAIKDEYEPLSELLLDYIEAFYQKMSEKAFFGIAVFFLALLISGVLMYRQITYIHNSFSEPIHRLIHGAQQVQQGAYEEAKLSADEPIADEGMLLLIRVFNEMADQVKQQIETLRENARVQKELQEIRFKELQLQINPHFMFNTLNMISDFAYLEDAQQTGLLLNKTAKMFRFSLDFSGKTVTLERELDELNNYIYIQQQRYGDRICFCLELPCPLPELRLPALTLQPLVENAIIHGAGMRTEGANICIQVQELPPEQTLPEAEKPEVGRRCCRIRVSDNGAGMTEERLAQVEQEMHTYTAQSSSRIGLGNVYLRLKMLWGDGADLRLENQPGQGLSVVIELLYQEKDTETDGRQRPAFPSAEESGDCRQ